MLATVVGAMAATIAREAADAPPVGGVASALIGSGASLIAQKERRTIGLMLIAAGGLLVWRQAAKADRKAREALKPARVRPTPPPPPPPRAGATAWAAG
jgi:hypothetical protein